MAEKKPLGKKKKETGGGGSGAGAGGGGGGGGDGLAEAAGGIPEMPRSAREISSILADMNVSNSRDFKIVAYLLEFSHRMLKGERVWCEGGALRSCSNAHLFLHVPFSIFKPILLRIHPRCTGGCSTLC